jgi:hypothetical protein
MMQNGSLDATWLRTRWLSLRFLPCRTLW